MSANSSTSSDFSLRLLFVGLLSVFGTTVLGGMLGGGAGAFVGTTAPDYYRTVARNGDAATFDPYAFGIGLGVTQGIALGACIGTAVVIAFFWFRSRSLERGV